MSIIDLIFPIRCFGCHTRGTYLCPDCLSTITLSTKPSYNIPNVDTLYFATSNERIVRDIINHYRKEPFAKKLAQPLTLLIISYLKRLEKKPAFLEEETILVPAPLSLKETKKIGFNPALLIAEILGGYYDIPVQKTIENKKVVLVNDTYSSDLQLESYKAKRLDVLVVTR